MLNVKEFIETTIIEIKEIVGKNKVISACSGGVDSMTATYLLHKAVGDNLIAVFINDGLRREGEPEFVVETLRKLGINTRSIDAKKEFFQIW